jgi:hypothetical protein
MGFGMSAADMLASNLALHRQHQSHHLHNHIQHRCPHSRRHSICADAEHRHLRQTPSPVEFHRVESPVSTIPIEVETLGKSSRIATFKKMLKSVCHKDVSSSLAEMLNLSILKQPVFLTFTISNFLTSVGYIVPYCFLKVCKQL